MDTKNQSFVVIEAMLSQNGEFELLRGYETDIAPAYSSHFNGNGELTLTLSDEQGNAVYSEAIPIVFNDGCAVESQRVSMAAIFKFVPLFNNARVIAARLGSSEVFSSAIAPDRPALSNLQLSVRESHVTLSFDSDVTESALRVFVKPQDGRLLGVKADFEKGKAIVPIDPLNGLGEVSFVVEATKDFRSSRLISDHVTLPEAATRAVIVEPVDQSLWPFGKRGSLIASVFDENGRHKVWDQERFGWAINGQAYGNNLQLEAWAPAEAGQYTIQLLEQQDNGQTQVLGEANVTVPPPNEHQLRYLRLMKELQSG